MDNFRALGLHEDMIATLRQKGYVEPTEIQEKTIPLLLTGEKDIIAQSQTGTGKTACFAVPIIQRLLAKSDKVQALILAPTRELALQITAEIESLKGHKKLTVATIYGGSSMEMQIDALRRGCDIVVGTPGRVIDLINRKKLHLKQITYLVIDEADEMLNMGFLEDIKTILEETNKDKRTLLFSATMPREIMDVASRFMKSHEIVRTARKDATLSLTKQYYYEVLPLDRFEAIKRIIAVNEHFHGIIFCKTKLDVDSLAKQFQSERYAAAALHGDILQARREQILQQFKKRIINILIATDVAARGIDVQDLSHVINYSMPHNAQVYIHRIGRTGRAGKAGIAITLVIPSEKKGLFFIEKSINQRLTKANLPTIKEIIHFKKAKIEELIEACMEKENKAYETLAKDLLLRYPAQKAMQGMLAYAFDKELDKGKFKEIKEVHFSENSYQQKDKGFPRHARTKSSARPRERYGDHYSHPKERFVRNDGGKNHRNSESKSGHTPRNERRNRYERR